MLSFKKAALAAALVIGSASSAALASHDASNYELRRIPGGPRPDTYVLVRAQPQRPSSLTGNPSHGGIDRAGWPTHLPPKGPQNAY